MANNSSAGVYVTEIDNSQTAQIVSTSIAAVLGESNRGKVNEVNLVTSSASFISQYGKPDPTLGYMHYSALAFLNEGDQLLTVRVASGAKYGGSVFYTGENTLNLGESWIEGTEDPEAYDFSNDDLFCAYAIDPGTWNQDLRVRIYPNTKVNDSTFYVDVFEGSSTVAVESYLVSLNFVVDGYGQQLNIAENINRRSTRIRIVQNLEHSLYVQNPARTFITALSEVTFAGGTNGSRVTTGEFIQAAELFRDPEKISVNMFIAAGLTDPSFALRLDDICQDRMDCMAILDIPSSLQKVQDAISYRTDQLALNSSYSAIYSPDLLILDPYSSRRLYVPPSGYIAAVYALTDRDYSTWYAPAGLQRGMLKVLGLRHVYNQGDRDALVEHQINPIRFFEGIGVAIWGADTLQTMTSALSNVNVRRLMIYLEKSLSLTALYSVFDPNDEILRSKLVEIATRFLQGIQDGRGLYAYGVQCDEYNNPSEVVAAGDLYLDIELEPVLPAKRILLRATINATGARFTSATAS